MRTRKAIAILLLFVMLTGIFSACGTDKKNDPDTNENSEALDLSLCLASEPETIDPALNVTVDGGIMLSHLFEGLIKWADNDTAIYDNMNGAILAPGQAESWKKQENSDGTVTYTFTLRDDIKWSDGKPVTAGDFVYSWQRLANPETGSRYSLMISMVKGFEEIVYGVPTGETEEIIDEETGETQEVPVMDMADASTLAVEAPDDKTFVVTLTYDCPYFEEICAFPCTFPVRQDIIEANGDQWTYNKSTYVSNGAFTLSEWTHNSYIKCVSNPEYYGADGITTDSITFQLMDDQGAIYNAFLSDSLQFISSVPQEEIMSLIASGKLNVVDFIGSYFTFFQTQQAPFDDARVREAFSLVIDRNYIIEMISQSGEVPATGLVPSGIFDKEGSKGDDFRTVGGDYYSVASEDYEANCTRARELLTQAGYPDGAGLPKVEYYYYTSDFQQAVGEALQNMWKTELGVDVILVNQDWGVFFTSIMEGNFNIASSSFGGDYNDPSSFLEIWHTENGNNLAHYSSAAFDAAIEAAAKTSDVDERMTQFHKAEDILIGEDWVVAPIFFDTHRYMMAEGYTGAYYTPIGFFFFGNITKN